MISKILQSPEGQRFQYYKKLGLPLERRGRETLDLLSLLKISSISFRRRNKVWDTDSLDEEVNKNLGPFRELMRYFYNTTGCVIGDPYTLMHIKELVRQPKGLIVNDYEDWVLRRSNKTLKTKAKVIQMKAFSFIYTGKEFCAALETPQYFPASSIKLEMTDIGNTKLEFGIDYRLEYSPMHGFYRIVLTSSGVQRVHKIGTVTFRYIMGIDNISKQSGIPEKVKTLPILKDRMLDIISIFESSQLNLPNAARALRRLLKKEDLTADDLFSKLAPYFEYSIENKVIQLPSLTTFSELMDKTEERITLLEKVSSVTPGFNDEHDKIMVQCRQVAEIFNILLRHVVPQEVQEKGTLYVSTVNLPVLPLSLFGIKVFGAFHAYNRYEGTINRQKIQYHKDATPNNISLELKIATLAGIYNTKPVLSVIEYLLLKIFKRIPQIYHQAEIGYNKNPDEFNKRLNEYSIKVFSSLSNIQDPLTAALTSQKFDFEKDILAMMENYSFHPETRLIRIIDYLKISGPSVLKDDKIRDTLYSILDEIITRDYNLYLELKKQNESSQHQAMKEYYGENFLPIYSLARHLLNYLKS